MKNFNFVNVASDKKNQSFIRWIKISALLISAAFLLLIFLHVKFRNRIDLLKNKKITLEQLIIDYDSFTKQKENLKKYQEKLSKKIKKLENLISGFNMDNYLISIALAIPENAYIENLEYDYKDGISLKGHCSKTGCAATFIENLKKLSFMQKIKLEYLKAKDEKNNSESLHEFLIKIDLKK